MGQDDKLLSYNGRINNHRKYEKNIFPGNKFSLKILNVTAKDVNATYRCRYGFNSASKFVEIKEYDYNCKYQIFCQIIFWSCSMPSSNIFIYIKTFCSVLLNRHYCSFQWSFLEAVWWPKVISFCVICNYLCAFAIENVPHLCIFIITFSYNQTNKRVKRKWKLNRMR